MLIMWQSLAPNSVLWHKAYVLGKKYKEKKLVKELLRCLPAKFVAHMKVLKMTSNINELKFDKLVGC